MAATYKTPGVYIQEQNAFPGSVAAVETAIPVFIGYTEKAECKGKSLTGEPFQITSLIEYIEFFGQGFEHHFTLDGRIKTTGIFKPEFLINPPETFYLFNCIRLFYQNGGSKCHIMSLGTYGEAENKKVKIDIADFPDSVFERLEKETEPTLVVIPDFVSQRDACYALYVKVLRHCKKMQSRFGIFDVIPDKADADYNATFQKFRDAIGLDALNYGAAYYPWLNTSVVPSSEISFLNLALTTDELKDILPETNAKDVFATWVASAPEDSAEEKNKKNNVLHQSLIATSNTYKQILEEIKIRLNLLPPAAAMAGIYTMIDNSRGVWKAPANISVAGVISPAVNISGTDQQNMNVDVITGKSINAIRPFPGIGTLVWGARTLDGNSQDWRYINVRRTMIMIEQSLKVACRSFVFEPNDANTWLAMKSMMDNFLINLWKQGALAGTTPGQAFAVQIGLGTTMTANDILDGNLNVTVMLAPVRPAEFIIITFQQKQQQS